MQGGSWKKRSVDFETQRCKKPRIATEEKKEEHKTKDCPLESLSDGLFELVLGFISAADRYVVSKASRRLASRPHFNVLQKRVDAVCKKKGFISGEELKKLIQKLTEEEVRSTFELSLKVKPIVSNIFFYKSFGKGMMRWFNLQSLTIVAPKECILFPRLRVRKALCDHLLHLSGT